MQPHTKLSVSQTSVADLFVRERGRFIIPHYQRKYTWEIKQCRELFDDILSVAERLNRNESASHFFSNLTFSPLDGTTGLYVVDGQQRLTTFSLFLQALRESRLSESIPALGLSFEDTVDQRTYRHLVLDRFCEPESVSEAMSDNFGFFKKEVENHKIALGEALGRELLSKLLLVEVVLPSGMPPQRVFERMNATKEPISVLDRIKNFLLMKAQNQGAREVYEYWENEFIIPEGVDEHRLKMMLAMNKEMAGEADTFQAFLEFYRLHSGGLTVLEFLKLLKSWREDFQSVLHDFGMLNGGGSWRMQHHDLYRFAPLLMAFAITFQNTGDRALRNEALCRLVEWARWRMAADRWWSDRIFKWSYDLQEARAILEKSAIALKGQRFSEWAPERLIAGISRHIVDGGHSAERARNGITEWHRNGCQETSPTRSIGLVPAETAEEVIRDFEESFARNAREITASR